MKKNLIKVTFAVVFIVAASVGSWKTYSDYVSKSDSELLLEENIEVLSRLRDYDADECIGPAIFAKVQVIYGQELTRMHHHDSIDVEIINYYTCCHAEGQGKMAGNNTSYITDSSAPVEVKCTGDHIYS